jgi:iron complex outermembrane receptor protein
MSMLLLCHALLASAGAGTGDLPPVEVVDRIPQQVDTSRAGQDTLRFYEHMGIVVTAMRTSIPLRLNPGATTVVGVRNLAEMPRGVAVDEAVRLVPGVKVDNQADGERVHLSIRGQGILSERGIRGVKVLLDGLPLNDPTGFAPDLYDVDWDNVERIEVLRGPGASLYGGGSTAGVINIATTPGGSSSPSVVSVRGGSYGFWKATGQGSGSIGDLGFRLSASRTMGDGYRVHTAFAATNLYGKGDWDVTDRLHLTPIVAYTNFFNDNAEGLNLTWLAEDRRQANPDATVFNEYQRTHRLTGGVVGRWQAGEATNLEFDGYVRRTAYREAVPSSVQHRTLTSPGVSVQLTHGFATGAVAHTVGGGTDVQWQSIDEFRLPNLGNAVEGSTLLSDQTIDQSGVGLFLFDRIAFNDRWGGLINLRYDRITNRLDDRLRENGVDLSGSKDFDRGTMRVGLAYSPTRTLSLYGNWGQGFLPPATEELDNNPVAQGGFNGSLEPALSNGEELGVRGVLGERLLYDLTLFHLETRDDFDRYRIETRPLETFYRNGGNSRRFGAELYANLRPGTSRATRCPTARTTS